MALVTLSDIYDPLTFDQAVQERSDETNAFVQSGAMVRSAILENQMSVGGSLGELPFYTDLTQEEPNFSGTDTTAPGIGTIADAKMTYRNAFMNMAWGTYDLAREIALADPLDAIVNRVANYWTTVYNRRLINTFRGVLADNVANDSSSLLTLVDETNGVDQSGVVESLNADTILRAEQKVFGDRAGAVTAIVMHSIGFLALKQADLIDYLRDSDAPAEYPTYLGKRVIVDDGLTATAGTNQNIYTAILFAPGAALFGEGTPPVPSAVERSEAAGEGGGSDTLFSRKTLALVPNGFTWTDTTTTGGNQNVQADEADLLLATNWDNVLSTVKNGNVAFINHN